MPSEHRPVLLEEALAALRCQPGRLYVDATVGAGGHAREILARSAPDGRLIGADQDPPPSPARGQAPFSRRFELLQNFRDPRACSAPVRRSRWRRPPRSRISSDQLADPARVFLPADGPARHAHGSRRRTPPIREHPRRAIAGPPDPRSRREPRATRIARAIARAPEKTPITTTDRLRIVEEAAPRRRDASAIHPATRTFQALRMAVNDEIGRLMKRWTDSSTAWPQGPSS
jgi:16S rRNA (cytosine1402-N4)-methyltransferase